MTTSRLAFVAVALCGAFTGTALAEQPRAVLELFTSQGCSSCPPAEAVTWGKVDKDTYLQTTESMQADYSMIMPFLVKALLDNRKHYEEMVAAEGEEAVFAREPKARGYLRPREGYRLFEQRTSLVARLNEDVRKNRAWLLESLQYPLV